MLEYSRSQGGVGTISFFFSAPPPHNCTALGFLCVLVVSVIMLLTCSDITQQWSVMVPVGKEAGASLHVTLLLPFIGPEIREWDQEKQKGLDER